MIYFQELWESSENANNIFAIVLVSHCVSQELPVRKSRTVTAVSNSRTKFKKIQCVGGGAGEIVPLVKCLVRRCCRASKAETGQIPGTH